MSDILAEIRTLENLRDFVHNTLCDKENLLAEITSMTQRELSRRGRQCGLQFALQGPRSVRLGAIALTLMPEGPSSWESFLVKAMMPPFAAA